MRIQTQQAGFTLIELIAVIVILGILAATAIPKFTRLQGSASAASIISLATNLRSAAQLQHAKAQLDADNGGLNNGYSSNGIHFDQGYPVGISFADADGIPEILEAMTINLNNYTYITNFEGTDSAGIVTRELFITTRNVIDDGATVAQIQATGCYVSYGSYPGNFLPPDILTDISGC